MIWLVAAVHLTHQSPDAFSSVRKQHVIAGVRSVLDTMAFVPGVDFARWPNIVAAHKTKLESARSKDAFIREMNAALADFGVSHLVLSGLPIGSSQKIAAYGFSTAVIGGSTYVIRVYDGTEAKRLKLYPGLKLTTFDFPEYPSTDPVEVGYRDNDDNYRTAIIHKEKFEPVVSTDLAWGDKYTCILRVDSFMRGYDKKEVEQLIANAQSYPNLVLDLRNNAGGRPDLGMHLLGAFLPAGSRVGAAVSKEGLTAFRKKSGNRPLDRANFVKLAKPFDAMQADKAPRRYKGHVAVLVNDGTGSVAEIVAKALQDAGVPIFGQPTPGDVLFANAAPVGEGLWLMFPWQDYWTANGERLEGHGVKPDFEADPSSEEASLLPLPLQMRAIAWLEAKYPASPKK